MATEAKHWPEQLDPTAKGYTKRMVAHFNFGRGKGAASYEIRDAEGRLLPVTYSYGAGGKESWFQLGEVQGTWQEILRAYPLHRAGHLATIR